MNKIKKSNHKQFENIYDVMCKTEFHDEARKEFTKFMQGKELEWDGDNDIISIGKTFKIKLIN